jgi:serine kinase of HPr protein (carbohydrate metabolism regulator)
LAVSHSEPASLRENRHGVAVAIGDLGLIILGESGAGKSSLAARMIAEWPEGAVRLVADDRVLVQRVHDRLLARPHPLIAGSMEVRGKGIVQPPCLDAVVLRGVLRLGGAQPERLPETEEQETILGLPLPCAILPPGDAAFGRLVTIWPYFSANLTQI